MHPDRDRLSLIEASREDVLDADAELLDALGPYVPRFRFLLDDLSTQTVMAQPASPRAPYLHPRGAGFVLVAGAVVGSFGPLHPDAADGA